MVVHAVWIDFEMFCRFFGEILFLKLWFPCPQELTKSSANVCLLRCWSCQRRKSQKWSWSATWRMSPSIHPHWKHLSQRFRTLFTRFFDPNFRPLICLMKKRQPTKFFFSEFSVAVEAHRVEQRWGAQASSKARLLATSHAPRTQRPPHGDPHVFDTYGGEFLFVKPTWKFLAFFFLLFTCSQAVENFFDRCEEAVSSHEKFRILFVF